MRTTLVLVQSVKCFCVVLFTHAMESDMSSSVAFGQQCILQESQDIAGFFEDMGVVEQLAAASKSQEGAY